MSITNEDIFKLIQSGNKELKQEIKDFRSHVSKELDILKTKIKKLEQENDQLKNKLLHFERKQKKYNIVVYGIGEQATHKSADILNTINEKLSLQLSRTDFRDIYRVGKKTNGNIRPVILETVNYQTKLDILNSAKSKHSELRNHKIYFSQDYAVEDYRKRKVLSEHLKEARAKHYKAQIKNNVLIVNGEEYTYECLQKNKEPVFEAVEGIRRNSAPATPTTEATHSLEYPGEPQNDDGKRKFQETPTAKPTGSKPKIITRTQSKLKY